MSMIPRTWFRPRNVLFALALASILWIPFDDAQAAPVCDGADKTACGGRTFPEPVDSDSALQFEETVAGLESLEAEFPDWVEIHVIGQSFGGRDLLVVELTNETASTPVADRDVVLVSQSIHGNEPGGREGGVRWLEDVLRDTTHPSRPHLDDVVVAQLFLNPDGWIAGDDPTPGVPSPNGWVRGNGNGPQVGGDFGGTDLNRNFPWYGWIPNGRTPVSEPETGAVVEAIDDPDGLFFGRNLVASTDIHGEVSTAAALTMLSAGQFDLDAAFNQLQHSNAIDRYVTVELEGDPTFEDYGGPAVVIHASSEFGPNNVGGSGSGFFGDWLAQTEGGASLSTSTIELLNHDGGPGTRATGANLDLLQTYREAVAGIMTALTEQAVTTHDASVTLAGEVGYVRDPSTTTDPILGGERTAMAFFDDLSPELSIPLRQIAPDEVADSLAGLRAVIVPSSAIAADDEHVAALRDFVEDGGDVVLTDSGVELLPGLTEDVADADILRNESNIAVVNFDTPSDGARDHPLIAGIRGRAFMMTEPATLGYQVTGGGDTPSYRVDTDAFEAAGGTTVGVTSSETSVGLLPICDGLVTTIGTLVPPPVNSNRIDYGLNDYGVLDIGYQILVNAIGGDLSIAGTGPGAIPYDNGDNDLDGLRGMACVEPSESASPDPSESASPDPSESASPDPSESASPEPTPTPTESDDDTTRTITRLSGADRVATSVAASRLAFETSDVVLLARADDFPDALAGSVLAAKLRAPLLLTDADTLSDNTASEVLRLDATEVLLLGGESALSTVVADELRDLGVEVRRIAGADRHATARAIAAEIVGEGEAESAVVARSDDFPDALAASNLATAILAPIVLTPPDALHPEAAALLAESVEDGAGVVVAGGPVAIGKDVLDDLTDEGHGSRRVAGDDRHGTAVAFAVEALDLPTRRLDPTFVASSATFPDALAAGPVAAALGGVLVLVDPVDADASRATTTFLTSRRDDLGTVHVLGGDRAISNDVVTTLREATGISLR